MPASTTIPAQTIGDTVPLPFPLLLADCLRVLCGAALVALLAQASVPLPFTPVPLTGQTFGVLLCGMLLGARRGFLTLALYLAAGAAGLPVFAGGGTGAAHLIGPTAGYLWSFPLAALLVGYGAEQKFDRRPLPAALTLFAGSLLVLAIGTLWLSVYVGGLGVAVTKGMLPFLPGELLKIVVAACALPIAWKSIPKPKANNIWQNRIK